MRKNLKKILALWATVACAAGMSALASCSLLNKEDSSSDSTATESSVPENENSGNGNSTGGDNESGNGGGGDAAATSYTLTCAATAGATVTAPETAKAGDTVKLTVEISEGYYLEKIVANGQELTSATFVMPACNVSVQVYAACNGTEYNVSANASDKGMVTFDKTKAARGETVTATIAAKEGYRLKKAYANGVELLFTETSDFIYEAKALMQVEDLVLETEFAENPVLSHEYAYALSAAYTPAKADTANSYWSMEYLEEGIAFRVLVSDDNVVRNVRLAAEERDFIEFRICYDSTKATEENSTELRCLVTADGTFYLQKCLGGNDYAASGYGVNFKYGDNFVTETYLCSLSKNAFDGYAVEIFLGYDLFGLGKDQAVGNMTFAPALHNSLGTSGTSEVTYPSVWNSAEADWTSANAADIFSDEYKCRIGDPATYLGIDEDGKIVGRYQESYKNAEYLFLGDSTFTSDVWKSFVGNVSGAANVAFTNMKAADFNTETAISFAESMDPANLVFGVGLSDLEAGASGATAAARVIAMIKEYHTALPETNLYWNAVLPNADGVRENSYTEMNAAVKAFADTVDYLTVIDCADKFLVDGELHSYLFNNGELTEEGYGAYVANVASGLGLSVLPANSVFGNAEYGYSSFGWTVSGAGTDAETLELTDRTGAETKYAYFKAVSSTGFTASATFAADDIFRSDETPAFGMVISNASQRLYFYVAETYSDGEFVNKKVCYALIENGETLDSGEVSPSLYYRDGAQVTLSVEKTESGIALYVGGWKAFEITDYTISEAEEKASVGVYAENVQITVKNATVE